MRGSGVRGYGSVQETKLALAASAKTASGEDSGGDNSSGAGGGAVGPEGAEEEGPAPSSLLMFMRLRPAEEVDSVWTSRNARVRAEAQARAHRREPMRGGTRGSERRRGHKRTAVGQVKGEGRARTSRRRAPSLSESCAGKL